MTTSTGSMSLPSEEMRSDSEKDRGKRSIDEAVEKEAEKNEVPKKVKREEQPDSAGGGRMDLFSLLNAEEPSFLQPKAEKPLAPSASITMSAPAASICVRCKELLAPGEKHILVEEGIVHKKCYECAHCLKPLTNDSVRKAGLNYCREDYNKLKHLFDIQLEIKQQPARYQIANYNIYPPIVLGLREPAPANVTITAHLMQQSDEMEITCAFKKNAPILTLRPGQSTATFASLKLNKMLPIKEEAGCPQSSLSSPFYLKFTLSPTLLPRQIRGSVRPMKQGRKQTQDLEAMLPPTYYSAPTLHSPSLPSHSYHQESFSSPYQYPSAQPPMSLYHPFYARSEPQLASSSHHERKSSRRKKRRYKEEEEEDEEEQAEESDPSYSPVRR